MTKLKFLTQTDKEQSYRQMGKKHNAPNSYRLKPMVICTYI